ALLPSSTLTADLEGLITAWRSETFPILTPHSIVAEMERSDVGALPRSWTVTSDSIAARIAAHLCADSLILLKSASVLRGTAREAAARLGFVDLHFVQATEAIPSVSYLNLRDPEAALEPL